MDLNPNSDFFSWCAAVCNAADEFGLSSTYPLRGRMHLRSQIAPTFQSREFHVTPPGESTSNKPALPTAWLGFLTLAGAQGPLPWWVTEKILWDTKGDGQALHVFLDLLNRRFWELLFVIKGASGFPYGGQLHNAHHIKVVSALSYSAVGLKHGGGLPAFVDSATLLHRTKQHCWSSGRGAGGAIAITELLTRVCGRPIYVREHQPIRLDVARYSQLILGRHRAKKLIGGNVVVGQKAWVLCALVIIITLPNAAELEKYLPSTSDGNLDMVRQSLETFYVQDLPPVMLELQCPASDAASCLGAKQMRLGWGALIANKAAHSHIVRLSTRALARA